MNFCLKNIITYLAILGAVTSCKKLIEVKAPVTSINQDNVYTNDNTAISVLTDVYVQVASSEDRGAVSMSLFPELSADNLTLFDLSKTLYSSYYQNNLNATFANGIPLYWTLFYPYIFQVNAAIEGVGASTTLTPEVKDRLLGEARFMRAFFYFYLVNLYGDVPLVLTTDYKVNATLPRTNKSQVYQQMIDDLKSAQQLLSNDYLDVSLLKSTSERIRPNKGAATALLSRVYLFNEDYVNAEIEANSLLENNPNYELVDLDQVFKKNSKETIWSLQPVYTNYNTWEARKFILPATGPNNLYQTVYLSDQLISGFDNYDQRLNAWTGNVTVNGKTYYYAAKYKADAQVTSVLEYTMVLRLAEQYLIRAECKIRRGAIEDGINDLNALRDRATDKTMPIDSQLKPIPVNLSKEDALLAVEHERRTELFTEWGHRWFDLKRTKRIDAVMEEVCPLKGGVWKSYKALYPIPQYQISVNPGMTGQQNQGYNE